MWCGRAATPLHDIHNILTSYSLELQVVQTVGSLDKATSIEQLTSGSSIIYVALHNNADQFMEVVTPGVLLLKGVPYIVMYSKCKRCSNWALVAAAAAAANRYMQTWLSL
jgi:hypothetical protein